MPPDKVRQTIEYVRDIVRRVERRAEPMRSIDLELRQLRSLLRAYSAEAGPDVLIFGDSHMYWAVKEPDRRRTVDIINDEINADVRCISLVGPGYNSRMVMAFLSAFRACRSRPQVVVVPLTLLTSMSVLFDHPKLGLAKAAEGVRSAVDAWPDLPKSYEKPGDEEWVAFDQLLTPTLIGQQRTMGELELFVKSRAASSGQRATRLRHLMDSYNAEKLGPESPGIRLVGEMATLLRSMDLRSVAYITAVNYELADRLLGEGAREHIERNADVAVSAFLDSAGDSGVVVNNVVASRETEFSDPLHPNQQGRYRLARSIAEAIDAQLARGGRIQGPASQ